MGSTLNRNFRFSALCFLAWTALGLFFFSHGILQKFITRDPTPSSHYFASWMTGIYLCGLLAPVILWLGRKFPIERANWPRRVALHLLFSVIFSVVQLAMHSAVIWGFGLFPIIMKTFPITFVMLIVIGFHPNITTYFTILGIQYGIGYYRKYQEREKEALRLELKSAELKTQLAGAQLDALKMQLQPHFLFNTLNAIMVLVRQQKAREAEEMLARLSDLLRCVLEDVSAQEVPLRRELQYLQLYLGIEEVRFQDRMRVEISADPETLDAAVPHMGLQPIVENAIRHGIGRKSAAGRIEISAARIDDALRIELKDDGPGINHALPRQAEGIGLANTRARLSRLYGESAQLSMENSPYGGTIVTVILPFRVISDAAHAELMETHDVDHAAR